MFSAAGVVVLYMCNQYGSVSLELPFLYQSLALASLLYIQTVALIWLKVKILNNNVMYNELVMVSTDSTYFPNYLQYKYIKR